MKKIYVFSCLFLLSFQSFYSNATNYYISNVGNDANNGQSPATPWRSLSKIPPIRTLLIAGDSVLLKRGDSFVGSLSMLVANSDLSKSPVVFSCYGDPNLPLPVFSGIKNVVGSVWELTNRPNVYKTTLLTKEMFKYPSYFFRDDKPLPLGRYPNFNTVDAGGILINNVVTSGSTAYVSDAVNFGLNSPDWVGGEFVTMARYWAYTRGKITSINNTTGTATISPVVGYSIVTGKGFFIQNHLNTLDKEGEWAYDNTVGAFYIYTTNAPSSSNFSYTLNSFGIDFASNQADNFIIENIHFKGFTDAAIRLNSYANGNKIIIQNCQFSFCHDALFLSANNNIIVRNNEISDCKNNGITITAKNILVERNSIKRIAIDPGSGEEINNNYVGINFVGQNGICRYNRIDSIGFNGIRFEGQNLTLERNEISNFTMNKHDGGAIYSFNGFFVPSLTNFPNYKYGNNLIKENIIHNGITSDMIFTLYDYNNRLIGSNRSGGIYNDENSINNHVLGNIVYNMKGSGVLKPHSSVSDSIKIEKNVFYKCHTKEMLTYEQYIRNHIAYYTYNSELPADPATKTFDILDNLFIETFPIKSFYGLNNVSNGKAEGNSFMRFDFNQDSTLFSELSNPSIQLSIKDTQKFGSDLKSKLINIQPELKSPSFGPQLMSNGDFSNGTTNWNFTKFNLNSTFTSINSPVGLDGAYANIAVLGGSFTAVNHYFELKQAVQLTANKLYELRFSTFSTLTEDITKSMSIILGDARVEYVGVKNTRNEVVLYFVPYVSGSQNLTIKVIVPSKSDYFFDNVSLREITNYSGNQEDYELFVVNSTETDMTYNLPAIPNGWYFYDPKEKSYVRGSIVIAPFKALYLIKTNRTIKVNNQSKFLIK